MTYKRFYLLSLAILLLASVYPIYMGITTLFHYAQNGYIDVANYQKYIIPYTPICIALICSAAMLPLLFKWFQKHTLAAVSILGVALFFLTELAFEQIKVLEGYTTLPLDSWQYSLCYATPEVLEAIGEPIYAQNNPAYKIHFYIIAIVIILAVLHTLYGFSKMLRDRDYAKKRPLLAQLICTLLFIGLCILACFTAFYRTGTLQISALSAGLMSAFFIVFGVTFGLWFSCIFHGKRRSLTVVLPAVIAALTTLVMYLGELILMGGVLFKFGSGSIFEPLGAIPFAIVDILVIIASAVITYGLGRWLNKQH